MLLMFILYFSWVRGNLSLPSTSRTLEAEWPNNAATWFKGFDTRTKGISAGESDQFILMIRWPVHIHVYTLFLGSWFSEARYIWQLRLIIAHNNTEATRMIVATHSFMNAWVYSRITIEICTHNVHVDLSGTYKWTWRLPYINLHSNFWIHNLQLHHLMYLYHNIRTRIDTHLYNQHLQSIWPNHESSPPQKDGKVAAPSDSIPLTSKLLATFRPNKSY